MIQRYGTIYYGECLWAPEDVCELANITMGRKMSLKDATDFLVMRDRKISERMTELGWEVLEDFLHMHTNE